MLNRNDYMTAVDLRPLGWTRADIARLLGPPDHIERTRFGRREFWLKARINDVIKARALGGVNCASS